jgi:hypothetical protein
MSIQSQLNKQTLEKLSNLENGLRDICRMLKTEELRIDKNEDIDTDISILRDAITVLFDARLNLIEDIKSCEL